MFWNRFHFVQPEGVSVQPAARLGSTFPRRTDQDSVEKNKYNVRCLHKFFTVCLSQAYKSITLNSLSSMSTMHIINMSCYYHNYVIVTYQLDMLRYMLFTMLFLGHIQFGFSHYILIFFHFLYGVMNQSNNLYTHFLFSYSKIIV